MSTKHTAEQWELIEDANGFMIYTGSAPSVFKISVSRLDCTDYAQARDEALRVINEHNAMQQAQEALDLALMLPVSERNMDIKTRIARALRALGANHGK